MCHRHDLASLLTKDSEELQGCPRRSVNSPHMVSQFPQVPKSKFDTSPFTPSISANPPHPHTHTLSLIHTHTCLHAQCVLSQWTYLSLCVPIQLPSPCAQPFLKKTIRTAKVFPTDSLFQLNPLFSSFFSSLFFSALGWPCTMGSILGFLGSGEVVLARSPVHCVPLSASVWLN